MKGRLLSQYAAGVSVPTIRHLSSHPDQPNKHGDKPAYDDSEKIRIKQIGRTASCGCKCGFGLTGRLGCFDQPGIVELTAAKPGINTILGFSS